MTGRVSNEEARERVEEANNPESLSVRACADLLVAREALRLTNIDALYEMARANDAERRIEELERERDEGSGKIEYYQPLVDAVFSIIDGLDDPYRGLTWHEVTKEFCADELDRIRAVLVPAANDWLAARATAREER